MDRVLDRIIEGLEFSLARELRQYTVKVSQVKKSFYLLTLFSLRGGETTPPASPTLKFFEKFQKI